MSVAEYMMLVGIVLIAWAQDARARVRIAKLERRVFGEREEDRDDE